nr:sodium/hydrogen exchanger 4-like isoform X2 [Tanacetum cinerariifolium]
VLSQEETPLQYSLVFGEGVVNDATLVVLFNAVQKINADTINGLTALHIFLNFLYPFTTSTLLGVGAFKCLRNLFDGSSGIFVLHVGREVESKRAKFWDENGNLRHCDVLDSAWACGFMQSYKPKLTGSQVTTSGILTVFFLGVLMSYYSWHNVTESSRITTRHVWSNAAGVGFSRYAFATLSFIAETFIFLYVGMDALDYQKWKVSALRSGGESSKISGHHQMVIWWDGLMRGAVSIALAFKQ